MEHWDRENSDNEEIEASKYYQSLVGPRYNAVHRWFRAEGENKAGKERLDMLSIGGPGALGPRSRRKIGFEAQGSVFGSWTRPLQPRYAALSVQILFLSSLIRVPTMSQGQPDDDQLAPVDSPLMAYDYRDRSLLGRVQPAQEIPEDLFSLSGPVSRAYRSLT